MKVLVLVVALLSLSVLAEHLRHHKKHHSHHKEQMHGHGSLVIEIQQKQTTDALQGHKKQSKGHQNKEATKKSEHPITDQIKTILNEELKGLGVEQADQSNLIQIDNPSAHVNKNAFVGIQMKEDVQEDDFEGQDSQEDPALNAIDKTSTFQEVSKGTLGEFEDYIDTNSVDISDKVSQEIDPKDMALLNSIPEGQGTKDTLQSIDTDSQQQNNIQNNQAQSPFNPSDEKFKDDDLTVYEFDQPQQQGEIDLRMPEEISLEDQQKALQATGNNADEELGGEPVEQTNGESQELKELEQFQEKTKDIQENTVAEVNVDLNDPENQQSITETEQIVDAPAADDQTQVQQEDNTYQEEVGDSPQQAELIQIVTYHGNDETLEW